MNVYDVKCSIMSQGKMIYGCVSSRNTTNDNLLFKTYCRKIVIIILKYLKFNPYFSCTY